MISLAGKAALITGGSRGIGAAAVKLFAQAGADVIFNYNKAKDAAAQVEVEARKHGTRVEAFKADVSKHADNKKLVDQAIARLGRLDILVANAGVWNLEDLPIEKMTEKQWDEMMRINLKSVYSIIHFTVPHMIKQKCGKIIPITSTAAQRGESFHTHYGASKGAIVSLDEGAGDGVGAAQDFGELGGAGLGGHGHVESGAGYESGAKDGGRGDSAGAAGDGGRDCGTDFVCRIRPGQLHDRRDHQCKWGFGVVRMRLAIAVAALAISRWCECAARVGAGCGNDDAGAE